MAVQLKELLNLDILDEFNLVAGSKGLDVPVSKVGILDYELGDVIDINFIPGELVLSNLLIIKDDLDQLEDIVSRLIRVGTSGLAIKTLYINSLPERIKAMADENDFAIFLYETTYYEDIITELVDYIKKSDEATAQLKHIHLLHNDGLTAAEVQKLAYKLNPDFRNFAVIINVSYMKEEEMALFSSYQANQILGRFHRCYKLEQSILCIMSFDDQSVDQLIIENTLNALGVTPETIRGGYSDILEIKNLNQALSQSNHAYKFANIKKTSGLHSYKSTGLYQLLMPLQDNVWVEQYYRRVIDPIEEYDLKNGSDLVKTAQIYVESGCDVKATAEQMFQHGNTIRYRLDRIKSLLDGIVNKAYVDQELSVIMRLYTLKNKNM